MADVEKDVMGELLKAVGVGARGYPTVNEALVFDVYLVRPSTEAARRDTFVTRCIDEVLSALHPVECEKGKPVKLFDGYTILRGNEGLWLGSDAAGGAERDIVDIVRFITKSTAGREQEALGAEKFAYYCWLILDRRFLRRLLHQFGESTVLATSYPVGRSLVWAEKKDQPPGHRRMDLEVAKSVRKSGFQLDRFGWDAYEMLLHQHLVGLDGGERARRQGWESEARAWTSKTGLPSTDPARCCLRLLEFRHRSYHGQARPPRQSRSRRLDSTWRSAKELDKYVSEVDLDTEASGARWRMLVDDRIGGLRPADGWKSLKCWCGYYRQYARLLWNLEQHTPVLSNGKAALESVQQLLDDVAAFVTDTDEYVEGSLCLGDRYLAALRPFDLARVHVEAACVRANSPLATDDSEMVGRLLRRAHGHALDAERAFRHLYVKAYRNAFLYGHYAERAMLLAIFAAIIVDPKGTELDVRAEAKAFGERYGFAWPRQSDFGVLSGRFRWIRWAKNINLLTEVRTPWPAGKFRQKLVSPEGGASGKTLIDLTRGSRKHSLLDGLASHLCES